MSLFDSQMPQAPVHTHGNLWGGEYVFENIRVMNIRVMGPKKWCKMFVRGFPADHGISFVLQDYN